MKLRPSSSLPATVAALLLVVLSPVHGTGRPLLPPSSQGLAQSAAPAIESLDKRCASVKVWQRPGPAAAGARTAYIELASGLHHRYAGAWVESEPVLVRDAQGNAGCATSAFPLTLQAVLDPATPVVAHTVGGVTLRSTPAAVLYLDTDSNRTAVLAVAKSAPLEVAGNRAVYRDAFVGLRADVAYTVRRGNMEQDILLYGALPAPERYGLSNETTVLAWLTRLFLDEQGPDIPEPATPASVAGPETNAFRATPPTMGPLAFGGGNGPAHLFARSFLLPPEGKPCKRMAVAKGKKNWGHSA